MASETNDESWTQVSSEEMEKIIAYWMRITVDKDVITTTDIIPIMIDYYDKCKILSWSTEYKNKSGLKLSDNNRMVERIQAGSYCWITADSEPVFEGKHCWRMKVHNPEKGWMCWGVAAPKVLAYNTFNNPKGYIWAIALNNCWYPTYEDNNMEKCKPDTNFKRVRFEMDILLDLDEKTIKFCAVGLLDDKDSSTKENEPRMWNYAAVEKNKLGWCPHVSMYKFALNATVRVAEIPIDQYGREIHNLFPEEL